MMIVALALLQAGVAAPAPAPPADALALGRRVAEGGMLGALLPLIERKDTAEMIADTPALTPAEQATLRRIAAETAAAARERLFAAAGRAYAQALSVADLRALAAFNASPAAARYRTAQPAAIADAMAAMQGVDFKRDTMAAFCAATGKGCAAP